MRTLLLLLVLPVLVLAGCASGGEVFVLVPVAGGEKLRVPVSGPGVPNAKSAELELVAARLEPKGEVQTQALTLRCEFKLLKPIEIRRVTVEDIAGDKPVLFIDDRAPRLDGPTWKGESKPLTKDDPQIVWLLALENSIRVYRFTVETADGRKLTLDQPAIFPGFVKVQIRHVLGLNY